MSDEVSIMLRVEDAQLLFNLVNQVQVQGKESMQQVLRIIHRLESVIPVEDDEAIENTD
tara:strand:+ start:178 stop:354 length:177 start_codon:yes stop_codon:yes gene_type:complete